MWDFEPNQTFAIDVIVEIIIEENYYVWICSLQKTLTALFNLVCKTQKSVNGQCFFECHGNIFLSLEKVLEKVSEDQP